MNPPRLILLAMLQLVPNRFRAAGRKSAGHAAGASRNTVLMPMPSSLAILRVPKP